MNTKSGSITQTPGGKYRAFFSYNGKRISKTLSTKQSALDWLAARRTDISLGTFVEPTDITLGQWMLECLRYSSTRLKPTTIDSYKSYARILAPLANTKLQALNAIQVQRAIDSVKSAPVRIEVYRWLKSILNRAVKLQLIYRNVIQQVDAPKYEAKRKDVFSKDEIARIFKALDALPKYKAFFVLAFATGCRIGELQGLTINNVKADFIRIEQTISRNRQSTPKTKSSYRDIPVPQSVLALIRKFWEQHGSMLNGYVFSMNRNGKNVPIATITLIHYWRKVLQLANVPYRNIHYIRHTHATQLLSDGVPILEVQHRLGHSNASITLNRYGHILADNKEKVLNAIDDMIPKVVI